MTFAFHFVNHGLTGQLCFSIFTTFVQCSIANCFVENLFKDYWIGDFDLTYAMQRTGCAMFLCYNLVSTLYHSCLYWKVLNKEKCNLLFFSLSFLVLLYDGTSLQTHWLTWSFMSMNGYFSMLFLFSYVLLPQDITTVFLLFLWIFYVTGLQSFQYEKEFELGYVRVGRLHKVHFLYLG